jgi:predicted peroxiredoxin
MERIEQIEMYLEGQLQGADLTAFEQEMKQDATLQTEVAEYKDLIQGIRIAGQNEFVHLIHTWEKELAAADVIAEKATTDVQSSPQDSSTAIGNSYGKVVEMTSVKGNRFKWIYRIAAAACVLVLIGVGIMQFVGQNTDAQLYEQNFTHLPPNFIERDDTISLLTEAVKLYDKKEYGAANPKFDTFLAKDPNNIAASLYAGISHLAVGETDRAIPLFKKVVADQNENFIEPAQWYLALAYIKRGDKNNALSMLGQIRNTPGHEYRENAKTLLRKLN